MRPWIVATGIVALTLHASAQSKSTQTTQTPSAPAAASTDTAPPPLTKTVAVEAGDSPMVRAAKRAVASRGPANQRRVVSLATTNTHGRIVIATSGPTEGPKVLPLTTNWATPQKPQVSVAQQETAAKREEVQKQLKELDAEAERIGAEQDEPYGHDMDEDAAEQRLAQIAAERKKLEQSAQQSQRPPQ